MSIVRLVHARSGGAEHAASAPTFLLRGLLNRHEAHRAVLLGGGVAAAVFAAALGAYVVLAERSPKLSADATQRELSDARVQEEAASSAPDSVKSDVTKTRTEASSQKSVSGSAAIDDPDAPRLVRTERFDGDPSVLANVRQFVPLPPDQVPVLDIVPPAQPPTAAPAALDSPKGIRAPHGKPARAQRHRRPRVRMHARVRGSRTLAEDDAPSDIGGTRMTALELQRDGSKNPLVSAFSAMLGPN